MARFRKGQRVRIARNSGWKPDEKTRAWFLKHGTFVGKTATITGPAVAWGWDYSVRIDDYPPGTGDGTYAAMAFQLEPLNDKQADAFIKSIKRLKPYEEPKVKTERPVTINTEVK